MAHDWILDVLADLRDFAGKNDLEEARQHIDHALVAVADELASRNGIAPGTARIGHVREFSRTLAEGRNT